MENYIKDDFELNYDDKEFIENLTKTIQALSGKKINNKARLEKINDYKDLEYKYSTLNYESMENDIVIGNLTNDFFQGTPRWDSPLCNYNVGTAPNLASLVLYSIALKENIYMINDGLSGNCCFTEKILENIFSEIIDKDDIKCIFTFGGTATNLYGMKLGVNKSSKDSIYKGVSNTKVFITEDAHYSHVTSTDWLGIGLDNIIKLKRNGLYSDIEDARIKMEGVIESGNKIGTIIINGGTTYDHAIDDIKNFRELIDSLVKKYSLEYTPHLHVDSVIGWSWLFFKYYDFKENSLNIPNKYIDKIKNQYERIKNINLADSWGVDFHKGVGSCPVISSMFCINNKEDLRYLSKKLYDGYDIHQISPEYSSLNPSEFTLETSRMAGPALAALAALKSLGIQGYQKLITNLLITTFELREKLNNVPYIRICNENSLGFCTMVRIYPSKEEKIYESRLYSEYKFQDLDFINRINKYNRDFFEWDKETRMNKEDEFEYSFSTGYKSDENGIKLETLKFYNVSPNFSNNNVNNIVNKLKKQLLNFQKNERNKYE